MSPDVSSFAVHRLVFLLPVLPLLLATRNLTGFSLSFETASRRMVFLFGSICFVFG